MQQAPGYGIESIATMQDGEIFPHEHVAGPPLVTDSESLVGRMLPQSIQ
jgi:hypothetical protein